MNLPSCSRSAFASVSFVPLRLRSSALIRCAGVGGALLVATPAIVAQLDHSPKPTVDGSITSGLEDLAQFPNPTGYHLVFVPRGTLMSSPSDTNTFSRSHS